MGLFGFGRKKTEEKENSCCAASNAGVSSTCCCGSDAATDAASGCCCGQAEGAACCCKPDGGMTIKVLGAGCKSCHEQYENVKAAVQAMGLNAAVAYVTDMEQVMAYGAMSMPAIVVNEKVVSAGKVLKPAEVEKLLRKLGC